MFRVERQNKHHVPQRCADILGVCLSVAYATDRNSLIIAILVIYIDGLKLLSEGSDFETQLQMPSHFLCGNLNRLKPLSAGHKTGSINEQFPITVIEHDLHGTMFERASFKTNVETT
jgi:hypothetical protein